MNQFQEAEFKRLGIFARDPLFITMSVMTELEAYPSTEAVVTATDGIDLEAELAKVQWLTDGLSPEEVKNIMEERQRMREKGEINTIKTAEDLAQEKADRIAAMAKKRSLL